jgi:hypothetical protein
VCNDRDWQRNGWRNKHFGLLREEGLNPWLGSLGSLARIGSLLFLEITLACFAGSRFVLFQEVLLPTHAHYDGFATNWAWSFSINDDDIVMGSLKTGKHPPFPSLL